MMMSRRGFLAGGLSAVFIESSRSGEASELDHAITSTWRGGMDNPEMRAFLRDHPVGYDRLWVKRANGDEMIAVYRDYAQGLAPIPAQCLNLSYFWRDVNDGGEGVSISLGLFDVLSRVQTCISGMAGHPVPINLHSGYRTRKHNDALVQEGAAPNSQHPLARAADFSLPAFSPSIVAEATGALGAGGVGLYSWGVHADNGPQGRRWGGAS